jgi:hypothetical protein
MLDMSPMPLPFAIRVQRLHRRGLDLAAIAQELGVDAELVREAHRWLALPVNDSDDAPAPPARPSAEREANFDRLPKRNQARIRKARES